MVLILKIRLQASLIYKIVQTEVILFLPNYSFQLETLEAFKIVVKRSTSLKLELLNRKLYVDLKNGLNFENLITNESVNPYSLFFRHLVDR